MSQTRLFPTTSMIGFLVAFVLRGVVCQSNNKVEFRIQEQKPQGTLVGNIRDKVHSRTLPTESSLNYKLMNSKSPIAASLFAINGDTGSIYTMVNIDRESICQSQKDCVIEFDVTVTSYAQARFFEFVNVRIIVEDINDNAPRFPRDEITLIVSETDTRTTFMIDGATDRDERYTVTRYEMRSDYNDMFELKSEMKLDGSWEVFIVNMQPLDREKKDRYVLHVLALDSGEPPKFGNVTVIINIGDVNDNPPVFSQNTYEITLKETAQVGSPIGLVVATDADLGDNAAVTYRFSKTISPEMDALFYIDSNSGEIMVKKDLQYESGRNFETIVEARDRGNPPKVSQAVLILKILDVGNTPPRININPVPNPDGNVLSIPESSLVETVVAHVRTDDRDEGNNGIVDCSSLAPQFRVRPFDSVSYLVDIKEALDREKVGEINVTIVCEDRGTPRLAAYGWFIVKLLDVNDNDPMFSTPIYRANLTEKNKVGVHVLYVSASDPDIGENARLHYSISMEAAKSSFVIDNLTGQITAGQEFDRETISQVSFMVMVTDGGKRTGNASVVVDIVDVNDNKPYFISSLAFQIAENLPAGTKVDTLLARDNDFGQNAEVFFEISENHFKGNEPPVPFVVIPDGVIRTVNVLKKDKQDTYKFPVMVKDRGHPPLSATATVTILVVDSNDHTPVFTFPSRSNHTVKLRSDAALGSVAARLMATDADKGINGKLRYTLFPGNLENAFVLKSHETGEIIVNRDLSLVHENVFKMNVTVHDLGIPSREAHAVLTILVDYTEGHVLSRSRESGKGNSTFMFGDDDIKYIIIAGVVGGVTVVISIIIVTIILRLRRPDNNNRTSGLTGVQEQGDGRQFDKQMWQSVPVDDVTPTEVEEKKLGTMSLKGGGPDFEHKSSNGGMGPKGNHDLIDPYSKKHGPEPFQCQPQLYTFRKCALRAPTDDHQSDTSGETTTSDSGRGGSEEDIQLPPLPELTDTSRMIFRNPGAGLKDSRFIQSDYADYGDREVIAFETFSPRTLPVSDRRDKGVYGGREVQTMAHAGRPLNDKLRHGRHTGYPQGPQSLQGSPHHPAQQKNLSNDSYWSQPSTASSFGPGHYPDDIPERSEPGSGKKVTFQTGLTTQNLKTWDLAQKMNLQPELSSTRSVPSGYTSSTTSHQRPYGARPKSQDDDDNTTTSGSYTINPENDFDDGLPVPSFSVA
ncbi:protocadherin gamma-B2-like isoform X2 [Biomphalaria glabrata]|uniref:Protocadherin gamma-B2-like isoform X2 n=1 Tax=Biomphalaria glabrata TaxID=6526 RepID=A0A9W3B3E8_BIOGL|nr:protocadherin gamma-B2-like isoform X2 [Biomphalaria glabrata]